MDFHSLSRKQLQSLCKKNKIPANITNLAMADSLQSLPTVEGIEELLLKPLESPSKSQVRVPRTGTRGTTTTRLKTRGIFREDESEILQTLTTTTTRTTRSSTRRLALESPGPDKMAHQTPSASTIHARKMETLLFNIETEEEDEKETPAFVAGTRRSNCLKQQQQQQHTYSTHNSSRSARLAEKNMEDLNNALEVKLKETSESVKDTELFLYTSVKEDSPAPAAESDHPLLTQSSGVDLKEISEQGFRNSTSEAMSGTKSDNVEIDCDEDRDGESKMMRVESEGRGGAGDDRCDYYYESNTELLCTNNKTEEEEEEEEAVEDNKTTNEEMECNDDSAAAQAVVDHSNDDDDNVVVSIENTTTTANLTTTKSEEEELMLESSNCKDLGMSNNDIMNSSSLEEAEQKHLNEENEMQKSKEDAAAAPTDILKDDDTTSEDLVVQKSSTGHSVLAFYMGVESGELSDPKTEQCITPPPPSAPPALQEISSGGCDDGEEAAFADNLAEKFITMELNTTSSALHQHTSGMSMLEAPDFKVEPPPSAALAQEECINSMSSGDITVLPPCLTAPPDSSENSSQEVAVVVPTGNSSSTRLTSIVKESPTPPPSSSQKTAIPLEKTVKRRTPPTKRMTMTPQVSDNKENVIVDNSAAKQLIHHPIPEKEKKEKKQTGKALDEISLRQLTKMLKEKLEITKKININDKITNKEAAAAAAASASTERLALQALSENPLLY